MKARITILFLSVLVVFLASHTYAQESSQKDVGDIVYENYQTGGVDEAIKKYHNLKAENGDYSFDEFQLNRIGYLIMRNDKDLESARKIFKLNMEEYPDKINPKDSYGDVLVQLGEMDEARKYYREAFESFQKNTSRDKNVAKNSKAKLAALDNKHRAFEFLEGNWTSVSTYFITPENTQKENGEVNFTYLNNVLLIGEMKPESLAEEGFPGMVLVITYNAQNETYECAYVENLLTGLQLSKLRIEQGDDFDHVFIENYELDDDAWEVRNEILLGANTINWTSYGSKNGGEFRKMVQHEMTKKEPLHLTTAE